MAWQQPGDKPLYKPMIVFQRIYASLCLNELTCGLNDWIGLDLFNDDTRPSGHISRPTQVNVSELLSFSKQLLKSNNIVQSGG